MPIRLKKEIVDSFTHRKVVSYSEAAKKISGLKKEGRTVGLCHGGFDLLHPGHIKHLESARRLCDRLFVSITSDRFVSSRKGTGRPVIPEKLRAYSVACLESVDHVFISDFEKAVRIIGDLKPSLYIKGPDFIDKATPGITAEREAIAAVGGKMAYTKEPNLSTTEILTYIRETLDRKKLLLVVDRDGTIIEDVGFLGKNKAWKDEIKPNNEVIALLSYAQTKYDTIKIVVSNQSGVARKYFTPETVGQVNSHIDSLLRERGVRIDDWRYCPDTDVSYVKSRKGRTVFDPRFVRDRTNRKPDPAMVYASMRKLKKNMNGFSGIIVIGDKEDDRGLAERLGAKFMDVKGKNYAGLVGEFSRIVE